MSICDLKVTSGRKGTQSFENSVFFFDGDSISCCGFTLIPPRNSILNLSFHFLHSEGEIDSKNTRKTTEVTQFSFVFPRESHQCSEILISIGICLSC